MANKFVCIIIISLILCGCCMLRASIPEDVKAAHNIAYSTEDEILDKMLSWLNGREGILSGDHSWIEKKITEIDQNLMAFYAWVIQENVDIGNATFVRMSMWKDMRQFLLSGNDSYLKNPVLSPEDKGELLRFITDLRKIASDTKEWVYYHNG